VGVRSLAWGPSDLPPHPAATAVAMTAKAMSVHVFVVII
jgi:hypothetical protein